jgi:hypothetical protein
MRHLIKKTAAFALLLLPLFLGGHARAAESEETVITLSCHGTLTRTQRTGEPVNPELLQKLGAVLNLNEQTVFVLGYTVPIESADEASINFGARQAVEYGFVIAIAGHIDRASGRMDITTVTLDPTKADDPMVVAVRYYVVCATESAF